MSITRTMSGKWTFHLYPNQIQSHCHYLTKTPHHSRCFISPTLITIPGTQRAQMQIAMSPCVVDWLVVSPVLLPRVLESGVITGSVILPRELLITWCNTYPRLIRISITSSGLEIYRHTMSGIKPRRRIWTSLKKPLSKCPRASQAFPFSLLWVIMKVHRLIVFRHRM